MSRSIRMELPSLAKEGWLRPLRKSGEASLAGADGHERSECEPDRAKQGRVVCSSHRLSEVERTTPSAPSKVASQHFLDVASTPPLPSFAKEGSLPPMSRALAKEGNIPVFQSAFPSA